MNVTASQIRQDFNNFGGFGQQGYGYNTSYLYEEIGKILGLDQQHDMILIGAGNLGQALMNYMNLKNRGFSFRGAFDIDPSLYDKKIAGVPVYPMEQMRDLSARTASTSRCLPCRRLRRSRSHRYFPRRRSGRSGILPTWISRYRTGSR